MMHTLSKSYMDRTCRAPHNATNERTNDSFERLVRMSRRHAARTLATAFSKACGNGATTPATTTVAAAAWTSVSLGRGGLGGADTATSSTTFATNGRRRTFASGLTFEGGLTPAYEAVPESIVVVPDEEKPTIDPTRGLEVSPRDVFGVVQIRSHQFKVSPDDLIYVDKINGVDVNDVVSLPRVLMLGNKGSTVIGRPTVPGAEVVALVEEQVRDGKKTIFKMKRRKNHRRRNGFRAQLTGLRILEVRGIEEE
jgi:large subunit ribosomal protein L21